MGEVELTKFTNGLVLKPTDDDLQISQVQQAENVDFVKEPGAVQPRRGINKHFTTDFGSDIDIYWARNLDTPAFLVRAGTKIWKDEEYLFVVTADAQTRFEDFAGYAIMVNGTENWKYKDTGMGLHWNTSYCYLWEEQHIDTDDNYASLIPFVYVQDGTVCTQAWEKTNVTIAPLPTQLSPSTTADSGGWSAANFISPSTSLPVGGLAGSTAHFDNSDWEVQTGSGWSYYGSWSGADWDSEIGDGASRLNLAELGTWTEGYRPTHVKVTYTGGPLVGIGFYSNKTFMDRITATSGEVSGTIYAIDIDEDFVGMNFTGTAPFTITNIEFYLTIVDEDVGHMFSRTNSFNEPTGATLSSAIAEIYVGAAAGNSPEFKVHLVTTANPVAPATAAECEALTLNTGTAAFALDDGSGTGYYSSPDLVTDLQAILDSLTWENGDSVLLVLRSEQPSVYYTTVNPQVTKITLTWSEVEGVACYTSSCYIGTSTDNGTTTVGQMDVNVPVQLGIIAPTTTLTATDAASGAGPDGTYTYKVTYYNNDAMESDVSPVSVAETVVDNDINLTAIPISPDPQVVGRKIYRIANGGTTYKLVTTITNNYETTYTDSVADGALGADAPVSHTPPEAFSEIHSHKSLLWGIEAASKNKAFYCTSFDQWEYFVTTSYEAFGSQSDEVQALETLAEFLVPVQKIRIWKLDTEESDWKKAESLSKRGTPSSQAVVDIGDALLIVDATGIYYFDTIKDIIISQVIEPIFDPGGDYGERINSSYLSNLAVGFLDGILYVSYTRTGQTTNDRTVVYHRESKSFQGVITQGFSSFTINKELKVIYGAGTDGYIYRLDNGTTDEAATAISWSFTTKDLDKELVTQSYELTGGQLTSKAIGKLVYKRAGKIRLDLDPSGEEVTVGIYLDGTLRQTRTYSDASRVVHDIILDPDWDFYRLALKFSGSTDSLVKIHAMRVSAEELT